MSTLYLLKALEALQYFYWDFHMDQNIIQELMAGVYLVKWSNQSLDHNSEVVHQNLSPL